MRLSLLARIPIRNAIVAGLITLMWCPTELLDSVFLLVRYPFRREFKLVESVASKRTSGAHQSAALLEGQRQPLITRFEPISRRSARMPRSEERGGMAARSEAEINSLLVYKSPAREGGVLY